MTLLQTHLGESDSDVRAAADAILQTLDPSRRNWWHPYEIRGTYRHGDALYREFYCAAGSVQVWLWKLANKNTSREVLMLSNDEAVKFNG